MKLTRRARRAVDRKVGRRELTRKAQSMADRIRELDGQGFQAVTIARKTGIPEAVVRLVLEPGEGEG